VLVGGAELDGDSVAQIWFAVLDPSSELDGWDELVT